jgi:hypothetical protein
MRCISSIPEIVTLAFLKRLKPSITLTLDLTMILFDQVVQVL